MFTRKVVLIDPCSECIALIPLLRSSGWQVEETSLERVTEHDGGLCILRLTEAHLDDLRKIRALIASTYCQWVAVAPPSLLNAPGALELIADWFLDYHTLPLIHERFLTALGRNHGMACLRRITHISSPTPDEIFVGKTAKIRALAKMVSRVAPSESPVLIRGESGTGKELVAHAIHRKSPRHDLPFVAINCGAIPAHLIQSELFGHEKGAFTGAHQRRVGRIESAEGGTLFLDEIGDLPLEQQANLLRVLQERQIVRVGSSTPISVDFRLVAATHVDLEQAISDGHFREDLYFRLNVLELKTVPLRDQTSDILPMAEHFASLCMKDAARKPKHFGKAAIHVMRQHSWPGNVRELANRVQRGIILAEGREITPVDMGFEPPKANQLGTESLNIQLTRAERDILANALAHTPENMSLLAQTLDISRTTLYRLLKKHQLK